MGCRSSVPAGVVEKLKRPAAPPMTDNLASATKLRDRPPRRRFLRSICPPSCAQAVIVGGSAPIGKVRKLQRRHRPEASKAATDLSPQSEPRCNLDYASSKPKSRFCRHLFGSAKTTQVQFSKSQISSKAGPICRRGIAFDLYGP